jgi:glycoprotein-N-acetylgalactosamine 3-beta-galactosyltransferase
MSILRRPQIFIVIFSLVLTVIIVHNIGSSSNGKLSRRSAFKYFDEQVHVVRRRSIRILCLILTMPNHLLTRALAINATWGPHCDTFFFITELPPYGMKYEEIQIAKRLPIAPIPNIESGYAHLTKKTTQALLFAYEHYFQQFDWFIKADDDTFLAVDHLKTFLSEKNTSEPITFGYNFNVSIHAEH